MVRLSAAEKQVVGELCKAGVRFMIVGGHAVAFYVAERKVHDLDIWTDPEPSNITKLENAATALGYSLLPDTLSRLQQPLGHLTLGIWSTDILSSIATLEFSECYEAAVKIAIGENAVRVLAIADLVASKSGTDREKDKADIELLLKADRSSGRSREPEEGDT